MSERNVEIVRQAFEIFNRYRETDLSREERANWSRPWWTAAPGHSGGSTYSKSSVANSEKASNLEAAGLRE
jgi:hypothetical protein